MVSDALPGLRDRLLALRADALAQLGAADHLDAGLISLVGNVGDALDAIDRVDNSSVRTGAANRDLSAARIVAGDDGHEISVTMYDAAGPVANARVTPRRDTAARYCAGWSIDRGRVAVAAGARGMNASRLAKSLDPTFAAGRAVVADDSMTIALTLYAGADGIARVDLDPSTALHLGADLIDAARWHLSRTATPTGRRRGGDPAANRRSERDSALRELAPLIAGGMTPVEQASLIFARLARYRPSADETLPERHIMARIKATGLDVPGIDRLKRILKSGEQKTRLDTR